MKTYKEITNVNMANSNELYDVAYFDAPTFEECSIDGGIDEDCLLLTKEAVIESAENVVVSGYGKWAGRKVWQLPESIKRQIKATMHKVDVLDDK